MHHCVIDTYGGWSKLSVGRAVLSFVGKHMHRYPCQQPKTKECQIRKVTIPQVRELIEKINGLEEQRDALERQVAKSQKPSSVSVAGEGGPLAIPAPMPLQDQLLCKVCA